MPWCGTGLRRGLRRIRSRTWRGRFAGSPRRGRRRWRRTATRSTPSSRGTGAKRRPRRRSPCRSSSRSPPTRPWACGSASSICWRRCTRRPWRARTGQGRGLCSRIRSRRCDGRRRRCRPGSHGCWSGGGSRRTPPYGCRYCSPSARPLHERPLPQKPIRQKPGSPPTRRERSWPAYWTAMTRCCGSPPSTPRRSSTGSCRSGNWTG